MFSSLSNLERDRCKAVFNELDLDKSNSLDVSEFYAALNGLGLDLDREQVQTLFDGADTNGDSELSLPEFEVLYAQAMGRSNGAFATLGVAFQQVGSPMKAVLKRMPSLNKGSAHASVDLDLPDSTPASPVDVAAASSAEAAAAARAATAAAAGTTKVVVEGASGTAGAGADAGSPRVKGGDVNPRRSSLLGRFMPAGAVEGMRQLQMSKTKKKKKQNSAGMDNSSSSSSSGGSSSRSGKSSGPVASPTARTLNQSLSLDSDSSSPSGSPRNATHNKRTAGPAPRRLEVTLSALEATATAAESSEQKDTATLLWAGVAAVASAVNASPRALEAAAAAAEASGDATRAALLWAGVAAAGKRGDKDAPRPPESRRAASFRLGQPVQKINSSSSSSSSASSSASSNAGSLDDSLRGSLNLDGAVVDEKVASLTSAAAAASSKSRSRHPPPHPKARTNNNNNSSSGGSKALTVNTDRATSGVVDLAALAASPPGAGTSTQGRWSPNSPTLPPRSRSSSSSSSVGSNGRHSSPEASPTSGAGKSSGRTPAAAAAAAKTRTQTVSDLGDDDEDEDAAAAWALKQEELDEFDSEWTVVGPLKGGNEAKIDSTNTGSSSNSSSTAIRDDTLAAPVSAADALASAAADATSASSSPGNTQLGHSSHQDPPPEPKALPKDWELWSSTRALDNLTLFLLHAQLTPLPPSASSANQQASAVASPRVGLLKRASSMASPSSSSSSSSSGSSNSSGPVGPPSPADAQSDFYAVGFIVFKSSYGSNEPSSAVAPADDEAQCTTLAQSLQPKWYQALNFRDVTNDDCIRVQIRRARSSSQATNSSSSSSSKSPRQTPASSSASCPPPSFDQDEVVATTKNLSPQSLLSLLACDGPRINPLPLFAPLEADKRSQSAAAKTANSKSRSKGKDGGSNTSNGDSNTSNTSNTSSSSGEEGAVVGHLFVGVASAPAVPGHFQPLLLPESTTTTTIMKAAPGSAYGHGWSKPLVPYAAYANGPSAIISGNMACTVLP